MDFIVEKYDYFFDGDKIVGLNNTVIQPYSQVFWILSIYLAVKGAIFIFSEKRTILMLKLSQKALLFSGSLILSFGYLGSKFPIINFLNFYIFGQNKRGMKEFSSIEGNTWRGFSSSAESIGEFFGVVLLILFIILFNKMDSINIYIFACNSNFMDFIDQIISLRLYLVGFLYCIYF